MNTPPRPTPFKTTAKKVDRGVFSSTLHHDTDAYDEDNSNSEESEFALVSAVGFGDYDLVNRLVYDRIHDDRCRCDSGYRGLRRRDYCKALHIAVSTYHPRLDIIQALLDNGCDVNSVNLVGTVLMTAIEYSYNHPHPRPSNLKLIDLLLFNGAKLDPTYRRNDGRLFTLNGRLLVRAAWSSGPEVVQLLLDRGASYSVPIRNPNIVLPLFYALPAASSNKGENVYFLMSLVAAAACNSTFSDEMMSILSSLNVDINELSCIVGRGKHDSLQLEYRTAPDHPETLFRLGSAETHEGFSCWNQARYSRDIKALLKHGGRRLPREPVSPRIWELVNNGDLSQYWY